jgi:hypothetical protein
MAVVRQRSERTHKLLINHLRSQPDLVWLTNFHVGDKFDHKLILSVDVCGRNTSGVRKMVSRANTSVTAAPTLRRYRLFAAIRSGRRRRTVLKRLKEQSVAVRPDVA